MKKHLNLLSSQIQKTRQNVHTVIKKKKITQDFFERSHNKCLGSEYIFGNCLLWSSWDHRLLTIFWNLVIICQLPNLFWKC